MSQNDLRIVSCLRIDLTEEDVAKRVKILRKFVIEDSKLKNFRTDDEYLLRFLYSTDFNVLTAFKRMQDYCDLLLNHPDWFPKCAPLDKKSQFEKYDKALLRERDRSGRNIMVVKLGKTDVANSCPQEQTELAEMWLELIMDDPNTQSTGLSVIVDVNGYSWRLFRWLTPSNIRIAAKILELYPFKELLIHVVNKSFLLSTSVQLVWPFLNERLKNRLKFHFDNWASLHEYISPEVLPAEYGGTGSDINFEELVQPLFEQNFEIQAKLKHYNTVLQQ